MQAVWGAEPHGADGGHAIYTCINRLRKKIEVDPSHPQYVVTVNGLGYMFKTE